MHALSALAAAATLSPPLPSTRKRPRPRAPPPPVLVWYRGHDLRVHDNLALIHALTLKKPIVCLFVPDTCLKPEVEQKQYEATLNGYHANQTASAALQDSYTASDAWSLDIAAHDRSDSSRQVLQRYDAQQKEIIQETRAKVLQQLRETRRQPSQLVQSSVEPEALRLQQSGAEKKTSDIAPVSDVESNGESLKGLPQESPILSAWTISNADNNHNNGMQSDLYRSPSLATPLAGPSTATPTTGSTVTPGSTGTLRKRAFDSLYTPLYEDNDLDVPLSSPEGLAKGLDPASLHSETPLLPISARNRIPKWSSQPQSAPLMSPLMTASNEGPIGERRRRMLNVLEGGDGDSDLGMGFIDQTEEKNKVEASYDAEDAPEPVQMGRVQRWHLHHSLVALQAELGKLGIPLVYKPLGRIDPKNAQDESSDFYEQEDVVVEYAKKIGAQLVLWNRRYYPHARGVEERAISKLGEGGIGARSFSSESLLNPELEGGATFDHFHPYMKFWLDSLETKCPPRPVSVNQVWSPGLGYNGIALSETNVNVLGLIDSQESFRVEGVSAVPSDIGCVAAERKLTEFVNSEGIDDFGDPGLRRDGLRNPDIVKTSKMSPHLRFGEVSPRVLYHSVRSLLNKRKNHSEHVQWGIRAFLRNLSLREFAYHMLNRFPKATYKPITHEFSYFPWREDPQGKYFAAWKTGMTGYPVVDAAMRQLAREGWMHNRMRFMVASFFCKYLVLPWPLGSSFFVQSLVDGDEACNTLGWQWTVGCNSDSFPFSTLVNPVSFAKQSPSVSIAAQYVRKYVPELRKLPDEFLFTPWQAPPSVLKKAGLGLFDSIKMEDPRHHDSTSLYPVRVVNGGEARNRAREGMSLIRRIIASYQPRPTWIVDQEDSGFVTETLKQISYQNEIEAYDMSDVTEIDASPNILSSALKARELDKRDTISEKSHDTKAPTVETAELETVLDLTTEKAATHDATPAKEVDVSGSTRGKKRGRRVSKPAKRVTKRPRARSKARPVAPAVQTGQHGLHSQPIAPFPTEHGGIGTDSMDPFPTPAGNLPTTPLFSSTGVFGQQRSSIEGEAVAGTPWTPILPYEMRGPVYAPPSPFSPMLSSNATQTRSPFPGGQNRHPRSVLETPFHPSLGMPHPIPDYMRQWADSLQESSSRGRVANPGSRLNPNPTAADIFVPMSTGNNIHVQQGCVHHPPGYLRDPAQCAECQSAGLIHAHGGPLTTFPTAHSQAHGVGGLTTATYRPIMNSTGILGYTADDQRARVFPSQQVLHHGSGTLMRQTTQTHGLATATHLPTQGHIIPSRSPPQGSSELVNIPAYHAPSPANRENERLRQSGPVLQGKPQSTYEREHLAQLMAAMNYVNPLYGNKFQEQWQVIAMHVLREYEITDETDRDTSRHYVRLCNLRNELMEAEKQRDIRLRAKVTTSNLKEFFKILNLPVTGEWDRRGHGGTRGPYVYGLCRKGENRIPRMH